MKVALVEDDPTVLELLAELLRHHGHDPRPVLISTGETIPEALDRLAAESAEVILMDLGMPIPGLELLAAAKKDERFRSTRYVIATASFDRPLEKLPELPDVRAVAKPYDMPKLLAALGSGERTPR